MLTLRFGVQADMRTSAYITPSVATSLGSIVGIDTRSGSQIVANTSKGGSVVLTGKFHFSNPSDLADSHVSGVAFFSPGHHLLIDVSNVSDVSYNDVGNREQPARMLSYLLRDAHLGYAVYGIGTDDTLIGLAGPDRLYGGAGNDVLSGAGGNDTLKGDAGNDRLDGGAGNDVMTGGTGNDAYVVDATGDRVVEGSHAGSDQVSASVSWTMSAEIENLTLTGSAAIDATGNASNNLLTGNAAANTLRGGAGDDRLIGGPGGDRLEGGRGDDVMFVDNVHDTVIELAHEGSDTVRATVSYRLGANVEDLTLLGSANLNGTGNGLDNVLRGNSGDNHLVGGAGNDWLLPGLGHDLLSGGSGADNFVFIARGGKLPAITDLLSGNDHLWLSSSAFDALPNGAVDAAQLRSSDDVADGNSHLVYNSGSGILSYDANGLGVELHAIVSLGAGTMLLAGDITVGMPVI